MAAQVTFGAILREARERKGLDLPAAARRLRIRPDILHSIEESDFARMPPRGYARNMVNAYARLVGLNPTEMTRMYLDEAYAYQVGRARSNAQPTRFDMGGSRRSSAARGRQGAEGPGTRRPGGTAGAERPRRQSATGRALYDDRREPAGRLHAQGHTHPTRHAAVPTTQYTNFYAGPKAPGGLRSRLPFVIAGAIVLVVLVVVLVLVFGNKGQEGSSDVPSVPITGLTDTSNAGNGIEGEAAATQQPIAVAPAKAVFTYAVGTGNESWIEIYEGESETPTVAEVASGPVEKSFDVTSTLRFVTANPGGVTIMVNGEVVQPADGNGNGVYEYTVDFPAILEAWKVANATPTNTTAGAGTTTTGAAA